MSISDMDSTSKTNATGSAKALVKGLALVDLIAAADRPVRLARLVEESGLPRATALRLLDALVEHRVLRADEAGYAPGPQLAVWALTDLFRGCAPDPSPSGELALAPPGCSLVPLASQRTPHGIR